MKRGQVVAYIEQLGTFVPVEVSCTLILHAATVADITVSTFLSDQAAAAIWKGQR